ncbi:LacI family DNA-binding transcriptional regulator [Rhodococcus sp. G-MC3]|uniref:LacI family DNA-binding transcriptional regulator n=1 Tax=Rhodococcus sp. G-MC3 TaxID=3046209 RepID=UPI0024B8A874|nr:LacI family DNA-binding transcriptional regulator [Rhodococcus sp. G-MC3]MDJ0393494.1 LacI family DNA-binding transcriptional regulator [Rhodococcus sp. G-MC3]
MADVARLAGVSPALVSIVMRGVPGASADTRTRIKSIAEGIGYVPDRRAQKLRQTSSRLLGVMFDLQQPFHGDLVEHIYEAASRHGYDVMLSAVAPSRSEGSAVQAILRERCEAAILIGSRLTAAELDKLASKTSVVEVLRSSSVDSIGAVRSDDAAGTESAVDHLVGLGHTSIAHIDGGFSPGADGRRRGFLDAMHRHGLDARVTPGGVTETDGAEGMKLLLATGVRPTAVVAFNDNSATGVLDHLIRRGIDVPGDISVVGYDDSRLARIAHIQLTSVSQDVEALADAAVENALRRIAGEVASEVVLAPNLVLRATSGPPAP